MAVALYQRAVPPAPATAGCEQELVAMKKRFKERHVEQNPTPQADQQAPTTPTVEAPPPVCAICDRPLPCPLHDRSVPALDALTDTPPASKASFEEAPMEAEKEEQFDVARPGTLEELHERIRAARAPKPVYVPPPPTERQQAQIDAEMAAGRRASERAQAQLDARPPRPRDQSEGTSTPVARPGNFDEYRGTFRQQGQTPNKQIT